MYIINYVNKLLEDLEFPPATVLSEPNIPETNRIILSNSDDEHDSTSSKHYTDDELELYKQLIILNNNYISSISAMIDQFEQYGWSEKRLNESFGIANAYKDELYKFGNANQQKINGMSKEAQNLIFGEYWYGLNTCRDFINKLASIVLDPEINIKSMTKEECLNSLNQGKVPFEPSNISAKSQKKLNDLVRKMKKDTQEGKETLSKGLLNLQVTQDMIKAACYTNPLTAAVYELYQNLFKPIKDVKKRVDKSKIQNYESLKTLLDSYFRQQDISLKDLDTYIQARKANKGKPLQNKKSRIGKTNYFLMEQFFSSKKVINKYGKSIGLEELEIYLSDMASEDNGEENSNREEQVKDRIDRLRSDYVITKEELEAYYEAWYSLPDTVNRRPIEIELGDNKQNIIGEITVKDFSKQLTTDKTLTNPDKLITIQEFKVYLNNVLKTEFGDEKKKLRKRKEKYNKKNKLDGYKKSKHIDEKDIDSYITDRKNNKNRLLSDTNPKRKVGNILVTDFEQFLVDNEMQDVKLLNDINRGINMDETLQLGQRFPLTFLTGKKRSDFKDNQEIIDYIETQTDYTVLKDMGDEFRIANITQPDKPYDILTLNECMLCNLEEIGDGITVFMPSGFQADLTIDNDLVKVDYYTYDDIYSQDEFNNLIKEGIMIFENPVCLMESEANELYRIITKDGSIFTIPKRNIKFLAMEQAMSRGVNAGPIRDEKTAIDYLTSLGFKVMPNVNENFDFKPKPTKHIHTLNKLDRLQKTIPSKHKEKQSAITLMDASGLGVDVTKESNELEKKAEKIDEISDELANKVSLARLSNFIDSKTEKEMQINYKKLRKNILLNKNRKKAQMSDLSETIRNLNHLLEDIDIKEDSIDEVSDEPVINSNIGRFKNVKKSHNIETEKFGKYRNIRDRLNNFDIENNDLEELDQLNAEAADAEEEWKQAEEELTVAKNKFENNVKHMVNREFRKAKKESVEIKEDDEEDHSEDKIEVKGKIGDTEFEIESDLNEEPEEDTEELNEVKIENNTDIGLVKELVKRFEKDIKPDDTFFDLVDIVSIGYYNRTGKTLNTEDAEKLCKQFKTIEFLDESLNEDIGGLTDVSDLDLPQPLADTIEVTDEGGVLTLDSLYTEIKALKTELTSAIQSIKDTLNNELEELKNNIKDSQEVQVLQNIDDKVDELTTEMNAEKPEETDDSEVEEETEEVEASEKEEKEEKEDELEESYTKFKKNGVLSDLAKLKKYEDLNKIKQEVDKAIQDGKDADVIQNTIDLNAADDKEKEEGREYAADKMTEAQVNKIMDKLNSSRDNCALSNIKYHK